MSEHVALVRQFIECYDEGRLDTAGTLLAPDLLAAITEGDGTATIVRGRDSYLARAPDLRAAGGSARLTQVVDVDADRTLAMVEIRAERRRPHPAQLRRVPRGRARRPDLGAVDGRRQAGRERRVLALSASNAYFLRAAGSFGPRSTPLASASSR